MNGEREQRLEKVIQVGRWD